LPIDFGRNNFLAGNNSKLNGAIQARFVFRVM